jgi:hypothetical protein
LSKDQNTNVDANSPEFSRGVEAGLKSEEDRKNWQAGKELGQELSNKHAKDPVEEITNKEPDIPLFLRDRSEGQKGNAQDEKDKSGE